MHMWAAGYTHCFGGRIHPLETPNSQYDAASPCRAVKVFFRPGGWTAIHAAVWKAWPGLEELRAASCISGDLASLGRS